MNHPFYFQNTTPEEHRALGRAKVQSLKHEAQGTTGFIWLMFAFVAFAYLCRSDLPLLPQVTVNDRPVSEQVAYRPDPHRPAGTLDLLLEWVQ
jgi:hypothetical protein